MAQPHCLYCDTPRPADEPRCPECGHPWIDKTIAEAIKPPVPVPPPGPAPGPPDEPADFQPPEVGGVPRRRWVFPVAITGGAVLVYAIVFLVLLDRSGGDQDPDPPVVLPTTSSPAPETTVAASTTDAPPDTATTLPPTTTTTLPPTTTTTLPPIAALGDPIPLEELKLGAFALGPLDFGNEETNALGRLVATFGQPDELWDIGEADGLCPTEIGRAARFGWLTVLLRGGLVETLVGYRLERPEDGADDHPTADLETISGAKIGDTVNTWSSIYSGFVVDTIEIDGSPFFLLARSSDERTLLWAPLSTDDEPAVVTGIYAPRPCDGGPFRQAAS